MSRDVKWLKDLPGESAVFPNAGTIKAGTVATLPDDEAERAIRAGLAEPVTATASKKAAAGR